MSKTYFMFWFLSDFIHTLRSRVSKEHIFVKAGKLTKLFNPVKFKNVLVQKLKGAPQNYRSV